MNIEPHVWVSIQAFMSKMMNYMQIIVWTIYKINMKYSLPLTQNTLFSDCHTMQQIFVITSHGLNPPPNLDVIMTLSVIISD